MRIHFTEAYRLLTLFDLRSGALNVVAGEPGMGKTTLLNWLVLACRKMGLAIQTLDDKLEHDCEGVAADGDWPLRVARLRCSSAPVVTTIRLPSRGSDAPPFTPPATSWPVNSVLDRVLVLNRPEVYLPTSMVSRELHNRTFVHLLKNGRAREAVFALDYERNWFGYQIRRIRSPLTV